MQEEITRYLVETHKPVAVLLGGSRATGHAQENSDWDIWLLGAEKEVDGFIEWEGNMLDITCKPFPEGDKWIITSAYAPLAELEILYDESGGKLKTAMERTQKQYELGPLAAYPEATKERLDKVSRWIEKNRKQ